MVDNDITFVDPRLADPFLRPDWRHSRVLKLISHLPVPKRTTRWDDQYIRTSRNFLLRWRKNEEEREKLRAEYPGMYYAWQLYDNPDEDTDMRFIVEARLLAGQSYQEIANGVKTIPETIEYYEKLFFNVSDFREHHDWIVKQVLLPASDRFSENAQANNRSLSLLNMRTPPVVRPHLDASLKYFSYFGGPVLCDYMISGFRRGVTCPTQQQIGDFFKDHYSLTTQMRATQAMMQFEINKYNVTQLFEVHNQILVIQSREKDQDTRHSQIEIHIRTMLEELPFVSGSQAEEIYDATALGVYDRSPHELNAEELILMGAGQRPPTLDTIPAISIFKERSDAAAKS